MVEERDFIFSVFVGFFHNTLLSSFVTLKFLFCLLSLKEVGMDEESFYTKRTN